MSYLSFSNLMNKVNIRRPLNCTPASELLVCSASDSLQQCMKQAPFSLLASLLALLCTRSPSLPPSWHTDTHPAAKIREKVSGATPAPRALLYMPWCALSSGRQGLGCVHGHRSTPGKAAAAQNTTRSRELSSIVLFFFFFLKLQYFKRLKKYDFI